MRLSTLGAALALSLYLAGCVTPFDTTTITTQQIVLASDAFNVVEATATAYERLPLCPGAAICRTTAVVKAINPALRAGYAARNRLLAAAQSSSGGTVSVNDFDALTGAVTTLKGLFAQYGIN